MNSCKIIIGACLTVIFSLMVACLVFWYRYDRFLPDPVGMKIVLRVEGDRIVAENYLMIKGKWVLHGPSVSRDATGNYEDIDVYKNGVQIGVIRRNRLRE